MSFAEQLVVARAEAKKPISCLRKAMTREVKALIDQFNATARYFNVVELITPTNANAEKAKFLASDIAHVEDPVFTYDTEKLQTAFGVRDKLLKLREDLRRLPSADSEDEFFHKSLLDYRLQDAILTSRIAGSISVKDDFYASRLLVKKFGLPDESWVEKAMDVALNLAESIVSTEIPTPKVDPATLKSMTFHAEQISQAFRFASDYYGFKMGWTFPISDTATACDVRSASFDYDIPAMITPATRECDGLKLLELVGHEVECHMRQEENGDFLFCGQGNGKMKGDETHLEGIAKISDINFALEWEGKTVSTPSPWYIIAINYAKEHGFADTARYLYDLLVRSGKTHQQAMNQAWIATYRAKRGNTTNLPSFVQPKDAGYFIGYSMAREVEAVGLGQYLEMGCLNTEWILKIAKNYIVEPSDLPFPRRDAVGAYYREHFPDTGK